MTTICGEKLCSIESSSEVANPRISIEPVSCVPFDSRQEQLTSVPFIQDDDLTMSLSWFIICHGSWYRPEGRNIILSPACPTLPRVSTKRKGVA